MERESDKHSARQDDELKQSLEGRLRSAHPTRAHEWNDAEPPADDDPLAAEDPVPPPGGEADPEALRMEVTRYLTRSDFPAGPEHLAERLRRDHAPDSLVDAVDRLPAERTVSDMQALINELAGG
ncbi:DUF2795 domain-containing protein [Streptomyces sp. N2-109]|uniref:DUF2795 domain-containing protein n=1 Tax=Streptomyces gossypii TaxID=2883101 RepID=A0ABT2JSE5_9ACTN|nr:DUF2795 domain-containing protein [Streptomyces gossypii]MCT2590811.1 DUF2795 domain-containing protein [Streptomyces gossypii]